MGERNFKKNKQKGCRFKFAANGRTEEHKPEDASEQALTDTQILQVVQLIKKCETQYGMPVDTEWAYEKGSLYLLQARPVTTIFPLYPEITTTPGTRKELYFDLIKASQGFQWSMSSLAADMYCEFLNVVKQGVFPPGKEGVLFHIHGRVYFLIRNLAKVYSPKMAMQMKRIKTKKVILSLAQ